MADTSQIVFRGDGRGEGLGSPAPEVSTIVIEAHAIPDAQPPGRGSSKDLRSSFFFPRHGRRRRLLFAPRQTTTARSEPYCELHPRIDRTCYGISRTVCSNTPWEVRGNCVGWGEFVKQVKITE